MYRSIVFAFAGDSTITRFLATWLLFAADGPPGRLSISETLCEGHPVLGCRARPYRILSVALSSPNASAPLHVPRSPALRRRCPRPPDMAREPPLGGRITPQRVAPSPGVGRVLTATIGRRGRTSGTHGAMDRRLRVRRDLPADAGGVGLHPVPQRGHHAGGGLVRGRWAPGLHGGGGGGRARKPGGVLD